MKQVPIQLRPHDPPTISWQGPPINEMRLLICLIVMDLVGAVSLRSAALAAGAAQHYTSQRSRSREQLFTERRRERQIAPQQSLQSPRQRIDTDGLRPVSLHMDPVERSVSYVEDSPNDDFGDGTNIWLIVSYNVVTTQSPVFSLLNGGNPFGSVYRRLGSGEGTQKPNLRRLRPLYHSQALLSLTPLVGSHF